LSHSKASYPKEAMEKDISRKWGSWMVGFWWWNNFHGWVNHHLEEYGWLWECWHWKQ